MSRSAHGINGPKVIYDLCGGTGAWSAPYAEAGYDVIIVDVVYDLDVRLLEPPGRQVYGVLAAPPCTHLCIGGSRWWNTKGESALLEGLSTVDACLRFITATRPRFWALENPVGRLRRYLGSPSLIFNPCDYGDYHTKKTCLWGEFNEPEENRVFAFDSRRTQHVPGGKDQSKIRSITPAGFAREFFKANR